MAASKPTCKRRVTRGDSVIEKACSMKRLALAIAALGSQALVRSGRDASSYQQSLLITLVPRVWRDRLPAPTG
jgi:hypothetical protein